MDELFPKVRITVKRPNLEVRCDDVDQVDIAAVITMITHQIRSLYAPAESDPGPTQLGGYEGRVEVPEEVETEESRAIGF